MLNVAPENERVNGDRRLSIHSTHTPLRPVYCRDGHLSAARTLTRAHTHTLNRHFTIAMLSGLPYDCVHFPCALSRSVLVAINHYRLLLVSLM
jgi:hypothetical protein